jgi:hypothetical protein
MTADEFMEAVTDVAFKPALESAFSRDTSRTRLASERRRRQLAAWLDSLRAEDQANVREGIRESVHSGMFGFCCVLDGVRVVEGGPEKGEFELYYVRDDQRIRLNGAGEELHDLFNWYSRDRYKGTS